MPLDQARFMCFPTLCPVQGPRFTHVHDFHELVICTNSRGWQFAGESRFPHRRGRVFCFPAGVAHYSSGEPGRPATALVIWLPDSFFSPVAYGEQETWKLLRRLFELARRGAHPLPLEPATERGVLALAARMAGEFHHFRWGSQAAIRALLQEALVRIGRDPRLGAGGAAEGDWNHPDKVARAIQMLEGRYMEKLTIAAMARAAGMSRSHFHAAFRAAAGCSPVDYLTRVRIRAAQRLLREGKSSVIQVALECGFPSLSRFYVAFKNVTRQTPRRMSSNG